MGARGRARGVPAAARAGPQRGRSPVLAQVSRPPGPGRGLGAAEASPLERPGPLALVDIIDRIRATLIAVSDSQPSLNG